jgi:hypothetical protein
MSAQEEILLDLKDLIGVSDGIDLMNAYKGLPIINKATIQAIHDGTVTLKIHKQQAACLRQDKNPLILCNSLREVASGEVMSLDAGTLTATLSRFEYAGYRVRGRMVTRVVPKEPIPVKLISGDEKHTLEIADICVEGIGVSASPDAWRPKRSNTIEMEFDLPNAHIKTTGTIRHVTQELSANLIGFDFVHGTSVRARVNEYVMQRREEILKELEG